MRFNESGTSLSGTDLHKPEGQQAGQTVVNLCWEDEFDVCS